MNTQTSTTKTTTTSEFKTKKSMFKKPKKKPRFFNNQRKTFNHDDDDNDNDDNDDNNNNIDIKTSKDKRIIKEEEEVVDQPDIVPSIELSNHNITTTTSTTSTTGSSSNNEIEEESTILDKIQLMKKKRKLKTILRTQMKIDQQQQKLKQKQHNNNDGNEEMLIEMEANQDLKDRLEGTFASTKTKSNRHVHDGDNDDDDDEDGGVLRKKHKLAMEQYIQSQMKSDDIMSNNNDMNDHNNNNMMIKDKKDLYTQLLQSSEAKLASITTTSTLSKNDTQEGDVGAGGAMLGGTGIAEVILSVDDRLKNIKETEIALAKKKMERDMYGKSMKTASSAGKNVLVEDVSSLGSSYAHNFKLHNSEWIENKKKQEQADYNLSSSQWKRNDGEDNAMNNERMGFQAKRGLVDENRKGKSMKGGGRGYDKSNDDQVLKNFIRKVKR